MNYPESITLFTLSQFHLLASKITMAQEPAAPAAPLMTPAQIAHQHNRDKAIRRNNCTFLLRIRLLTPLRDILTSNAEGVYTVPSFFTDDVNELARISDFFTNDVKVQIVANGFRCVAFEPNGHYTSVKVQIVANGVYNLVVPWRAMLQRYEVEEKGVLSMWGFYLEDGMPRFIFRHDGYAGVGEELPPLTDMNVVDPEPGQDDQIINQQQDQDGRCNCCNVG